jgi:inorganic pyrophosphatase
MNLWHEIDSGEKDNIHVIVEINRGSKNKYEIDKETGLIALDRVAYTAQDLTMALYLKPSGMTTTRLTL